VSTAPGPAPTAVLWPVATSHTCSGSHGGRGPGTARGGPPARRPPAAARAHLHARLVGRGGGQQAAVGAPAEAREAAGGRGGRGAGLSAGGAHRGPDPPGCPSAASPGAWQPRGQVAQPGPAPAPARRGAEGRARLPRRHEPQAHAPRARRRQQAVAHGAPSQAADLRRIARVAGNAGLAASPGAHAHASRQHTGLCTRARPRTCVCRLGCVSTWRSSPLDTAACAAAALPSAAEPGPAPAGAAIRSSARPPPFAGGPMWCARSSSCTRPWPSAAAKRGRRGCQASGSGASRDGAWQPANSLQKGTRLPLSIFGDGHEPPG
jgi:hypothetical protein